MIYSQPTILLCVQDRSNHTVVSDHDDAIRPLRLFQRTMFASVDILLRHTRPGNPAPIPTIGSFVLTVDRWNNNVASHPAIRIAR